MKIIGQNQIGYTCSSLGKVTFQTIDPELGRANGWIFHEATIDEIDSAVKLATEAFKVYGKSSGIEKAAFLNQIADELLALGDMLIKVYCQETGLPEGRARGERGRTIGQLRAFAQLVEEGSWVEATIDTAVPDRLPVPKADLRKMMVPLGPIAVFGASNFPLAFSTAGGDTASALASGCPVIVKSHPMHAGTGELVATAIGTAAEKLHLPNGVFSNLNSSGIEVGKKLVEHPGIKAVGFTGSSIGGKALFDLALKRDEPIPVFAEMGSVNPVIILPGALKEKAEEWAKTYALSITLGTGQFCTKPGLLLLLEDSNTPTFVELLSDEILKIEPSCMLHPKISETYEKKKQAMASHEELSWAADYTSNVRVNHARQALVTVSGKDFLLNPQLHQEVFGPFAIIVTCENTAMLTTIINNLEGQLTGTIIAGNEELFDSDNIINVLQHKVGRLIFNGVPTGVEVCPSMQHGGPYPASTDSRFSAVGISAIKRWVRPLSFQNWPDRMLPDELKNENPLKIGRLLNSVWSKDSVMI
ncbi:MAG: aldehyde dehydrogenase (NADP(+)) [Bacteroidota bacterium]